MAGMESLMERIRFKQAESSIKTLSDTSKVVRIAMADRRHSLDTQDKSILRSCLDTLQVSSDLLSALCSDWLIFYC